MKKIFLSMLIVLVFATAMNAQRDSKVTGGLYVNGGVSWLGSDSKFFTRDGAKFAAGFGAMMDVYFSNNFAFSVSAGYTNIGGGATYLNGAARIFDNDSTPFGGPLMRDYRYSVSYIEIPVGFKGCTNEIGYMTYFLKAGVTPMLRLKSKFTLETKESFVANKATEFFNMGWYIGGGFELSLQGNTRLLVDVAYQGTFMDIDNIKVYKEDVVTNPEPINPKIHTGAVMLKVGVLF